MKEKTFALSIPLALLLACGVCAAGVTSAAHTKAETAPPLEAPAADPDQPVHAVRPVHAGELDTPKGALRAYDAALPAGGLDAAASAYHAESDKERRLAARWRALTWRRPSSSKR